MKHAHKRIITLVAAASLAGFLPALHAQTRTEDDARALAGRDQARQLKQARQNLDDLAALAEHPEASTILLGEDASDPLVRALTAIVIEPAPVIVVPPGDAGAPDAPATPEPAAEPLPPLVPAGAWISKTPGKAAKVIFVSGTTHQIIFEGETFVHGIDTYRLEAVTDTGIRTRGQAHYDIELRRNGEGTTNTLRWPEVDEG